MTDVLIAGGGIAGCALAIMLGREGLAVELFERGTFPKEKPCGEGLMPAGVSVLARLGLADAIGGVPFYGVRYHYRDRSVEGRFPAVNGVAVTGRGQRRRHLDQTLFQVAAATSCVRAYAGSPVDAPLCEHGRVVGLIVQGEKRRAPLVVVADGLHSRLRHLLGLEASPSYRRRFGIRTHFRLANGQAQPPWVEVFINHGYELYVTPLPQGEILVAGLAEQKGIREPVEKAFRRWMQAQPLLAARLEGAEQLTPIMGASPLSGRARCGVVPGAVLLGDAAGFLDPITGGGMAQALLTAELLSAYLYGRLPEDDSWLWAFERERQAMLVDYRTVTQIALWLIEHPWLTRPTLRALQAFPALFSHLIGVCGGVRGLL